MPAKGHSKDAIPPLPKGVVRTQREAGVILGVDASTVSLWSKMQGFPHTKDRRGWDTLRIAAWREQFGLKGAAETSDLAAAKLRQAKALAGIREAQEKIAEMDVLTRAKELVPVRTWNILANELCRALHDEREELPYAVADICCDVCRDVVRERLKHELSLTLETAQANVDRGLADLKAELQKEEEQQS